MEKSYTLEFGTQHGAMQLYVCMEECSRICMLNWKATERTNIARWLAPIRPSRFSYKFPLNLCSCHYTMYIHMYTQTYVCNTQMKSEMKIWVYEKKSLYIHTFEDLFSYDMEWSYGILCRLSWFSSDFTHFDSSVHYGYMQCFHQVWPWELIQLFNRET